jgi:hypothetical protein
VRDSQKAYAVADQHPNPVLLLAKVLEYFGDYQAAYDKVATMPITPIEKMNARDNAKYDCQVNVMALLESQFEHDIEREDV